MISKEEARKVALWWGKQITIPAQNMGTVEQGGDELANLMGTMLAAKNRPSEAKVDKFVAALTDIIIKKDVYYLDVDYAPDSYLGEAAQIAGINPSVFPWKSHTRLIEGKSECSRGYGSRYERINL